MGKSIRNNRYAAKRKHKRQMKKKYSILCDGYATNTHLTRQRHERWMEEEWRWWHPDPRNNGYHYWCIYDLSGRRGYGKDRTNRTIRAMYRDLLHDMDDDTMEDLVALRGSDYEKMYDYAYEIW